MPGYANVKPGVGRAVLEEGETIEDAWTELNRRAKEWHKKEYPHLCETESEPVTQQLVKIMKEPIIRSKQPEQDRIDLLTADIYSCKDLKTLETYRLMAKSDSILQAAYDQQYEKFSK